MKRIFAYASLAMLSAAAFAVDQEKWEDLGSARLDYFDKEGQRVYSTYCTRDAQVFRVYGSGESASVQGANGEFTSLRLVQPGVYSYPVEIETADDVTVSVTVTGSGAPERRVSARYADIDARADLDIKSGDSIQFTIDIPEKAFPVMEIGYEYTGYRDSEGVLSTVTDRLPWAEDLLFSTSHFSWSYNFDKEYRDRTLEWYRGDGNFVRDPEVKGRWHVRMAMPNEPMDLSFYCEYADSRMLETSVHNALQKIYDFALGGNSTVGTFFNGEPWTMMICGEAFSCDDFSIRTEPYGNVLQYLLNPNTAFNYYPWRYYVGMIDMVNKYLERIPEVFAELPAQEIAVACARLRVLRAHAWWRMLQLYGPSLENSKDGTMPVAPLYTEWGELDIPLSTFSEILNFARADLDNAVAALAGADDADGMYPGEYVARGVRVRLSMLAGDWQRVEEDTEVILDRFPLTTNEEMKAGFCEAAPSWIWRAWNPQLYYWSYQCSAAINGAYTIYWGRGSVVGCIDRDLFLSIPKDDIRRGMFVMPESLSLRRPLTNASFFNPAMINTVSMAFKNPILYDVSLAMIKAYQPDFVEGDLPGDPYAFPLYFGNQMKFWGHVTNIYSDKDEVCLMRADEMLLSRAEALCEAGKEAEARECIVRLNSMRNPEYSCELSGRELLEEIRLSRRIELWGEGHSFFDFKRWNLPLVRHEWIEKDTESGNWPESWAGTFMPEDYNGFRFMLPLAVVQDNPKIDVGSLGYSDSGAYAGTSDLPGKAAGEECKGRHSLKVLDAERLPNLKYIGK